MHTVHNVSTISPTKQLSSERISGNNSSSRHRSAAHLAPLLCASPLCATLQVLKAGIEAECIVCHLEVQLMQGRNTKYIGIEVGPWGVLGSSVEYSVLWWILTYGPPVISSTRRRPLPFSASYAFGDR